MNTPHTDSPAPRPNRWLMLGAFLLLTLAISAVGGALTAPKIPTWYAGLAKPAFNPPNWIFAPVWTVLYILLAILGWRVWRLPDSIRRRQALRLYAGQLALNAVWSPVFFALEMPAAALAVLIAMVLLTILLVRMLWQLERIAALLLLPYLGWIAFASLLNAMIVRLN